MSRLATLFFGALALAVCLAAEPPSKTKVHGFALSGTVVSVDESNKTFVVRSGAGRQTALSWTDATKMAGGILKAGERVTLRYFDRDRRHIATFVRIGGPRPQKPARPVATPTAAPPIR